MAIAEQPQPSSGLEVAANMRDAYKHWMEAQQIPIHRGYFIDDVRTVEVAPWEERGCNACFLELAGQQGVSETRITEIPPGATTEPVRFNLDEMVYVADGRGLTTVWAEGQPRKTFEWQKHSMFLLPRGYNYQLSNAQGNHAARLMHVNHLPMAMRIVPDPKLFFDAPYVDPDILYGEGAEFYSEAKAIAPPPGSRAEAMRRVIWLGNFFPDMRVWDKLHTYAERGAGGHRVGVQFAKSSLWSHMSVFPSRTYKKGHRHGPGVVIIIPAGEGYSIMWPEGAEKVVVPWHEASVFVPPDRWFHQHFNVGGEPARYLAFHGPQQTQGRQVERIESRRDQIEYPEEDPFIRNKFQSELAARGLTSLMPDQAYSDPDYKWDYDEEE
jgi:oxalate decarboxylase/phosphoglucose isomerase-like protein (cupin superfamily)